MSEPPTCCYFGCDAPAVVWLSVAHDRGDPLCGTHADEMKAYIKARVGEFDHTLSDAPAEPSGTTLRGRSER